jgi:Fic family protein
MEPYIPEHLPLNLSALNWQAIATKISKASAALAYYNGTLLSIIDPTLFLAPLETKEAVFSSRIEGTMTTVDEVLRYEVDLKPDSLAKQNDVIEVLNYRKAMRSARSWLGRKLPFNLTFICAIQNDLMQGVRGKDKHPGEIRKEQVWIGARDLPQEQATYVPPEPMSLRNYLDNLIDYLHLNDQEVLIQTAIMHAQFEIIHPFLDGNGRTGRILIPLYLWYKQRLSAPMFYISEYLEEHRDQYMANLKEITDTQNWEQWLLFFLDAITTQAQRNADKAIQVWNLYHEMQLKITTLSKSPHAMRVLDTLFALPIFRTPELIKVAGIDAKSAHRLIALLKREGLLNTLKEHAGRSPEVLSFAALYQLVR